MAQHQAGALSFAALGALLSRAAQASAVGRLRWSLRKPRCHQGVLTVQTKVSGLGDGLLRIYFVELAPSEPSLQYLVGGVSVRRLDVNGDHRAWVNQTHKHTYEPNTGREDAYLPCDIPDVPLGPTVAPGTYQRVFEAFASECHVSLPGGYWTEPQ